MLSQPFFTFLCPFSQKQDYEKFLCKISSLKKFEKKCSSQKYSHQSKTQFFIYLAQKRLFLVDNNYNDMQ